MLSFLGVWSSFGANATAFSAWIGALLAVVLVGLALPPSRGATFDPSSRRFSIPGSWLPLAGMMVIFFTKYAVAVARATGADIASSAVVVVGICIVCGLCSGLFLARALRVWRTAWRVDVVEASPL